MVIGKSRTRERIIELSSTGGGANAISVSGAQRTEVPLPFRQGGQIVLRSERYPLAQWTVVEEKERPVANDGAADIEAQLIALRQRAGLTGSV